MTFIPNHDGKGTWFVDSTWLSFPGPIPDDLPEEFTLEDMEALDIPPDYEGVARAEHQKQLIREMIERERAAQSRSTIF